MTDDVITFTTKEETEPVQTIVSETKKGRTAAQKKEDAKQFCKDFQTQYKATGTIPTILNELKKKYGVFWDVRLPWMIDAGVLTTDFNDAEWNRIYDELKEKQRIIKRNTKLRHTDGVNSGKDIKIGNTVKILKPQKHVKFNKNMTVLERLRHFPKGTELYSEALGCPVTFNSIRGDKIIVDFVNHDTGEVQKLTYTASGKTVEASNVKVTLLPPNRKSWNTFMPYTMLDTPRPVAYKTKTDKGTFLTFAWLIGKDYDDNLFLVPDVFGNVNKPSARAKYIEKGEYLCVSADNVVAWDVLEKTFNKQQQKEEVAQTLS